MSRGPSTALPAPTTTPERSARSLAWGDISKRERALLRVMLELEDVMSATGADTEADRAWFAWAEQAHTHVRAWLVGKGFPL